eukprot:9863945-Lingulodinium_polyedra.AAC.1
MGVGLQPKQKRSPPAARLTTLNARANHARLLAECPNQNTAPHLEQSANKDIVRKPTKRLGRNDRPAARRHANE